MPSEWKQQCEGKAKYRWHDHGGIEVDDEANQISGFIRYVPEHSRAKNIREFWGKYAKLIIDHAGAANIPVAWIVAIIAIESRGDPYACAACDPKNCSVAPNCGGGRASNGKTYSCCAYGLMQAINSEATRRGLSSGADLLGRPDDSIRVGVDVFKEKLRASEDDPLIAAKRYNGCGKNYCRGGRVLVCNDECMFGIGGQGNFATQFALLTNTFLSLNLDANVPPLPPDLEPVVAEEAEASSWGLVLGLGALAALGALTWRLGLSKRWWS